MALTEGVKLRFWQSPMQDAAVFKLDTAFLDGGFLDPELRKRLTGRHERNSAGSNDRKRSGREPRRCPNPPNKQT
jgi:hypothetical protein